MEKKYRISARGYNIWHIYLDCRKILYNNLKAWPQLTIYPDGDVVEIVGGFGSLLLI